MQTSNSQQNKEHWILNSATSFQINCVLRTRSDMNRKHYFFKNKLTFLLSRSMLSGQIKTMHKLKNYKYLKKTDFESRVVLVVIFTGWPLMSYVWLYVIRQTQWSSGHAKFSACVGSSSTCTPCVVTGYSSIIAPTNLFNKNTTSTAQLALGIRK